MKVYISRNTRYSNRKYHTTECRNLPENAREIELSKLNDSYAKCEICKGNVSKGGYDKSHYEALKNANPEEL